MAPPTIAILTDFGALDPFAGIMKGVIAAIAPDARTIDLTHAIPPGNIRRGALALWQSAPYFPEETIFLCVVDPGVGTARRGVRIEAPVETGQGVKHFTFVGPDNGLFGYTLRSGFQAWELANPAYRLPSPSSTFHGRDIFAPAAAYAANGIPGSQFGLPIEQLVELPYPRLAVTEGVAEGEILYADRFGNLLTSLGRLISVDRKNLRLQAWVPDTGPEIIFDRQATRLILPDGSELRLTKTFGELHADECAGIVGSTGLLEIAANGQSAERLLGLKIGDLIKLID